MNVTHPDFGSMVPRLGGHIPAPEDLHEDILARVPPARAAADRRAVAYFDLSGGKVEHIVKNKCAGRIEGTSGPYLPFAFSTTFRFTFGDQAVLEVRRATGVPHKIRLHGINVAMSVANEFPGSACESHFDMFKRVAKANITLPKIEKDPNCDCKEIKDLGVPGCGNTNWP